MNFYQPSSDEDRASELLLRQSIGLARWRREMLKRGHAAAVNGRWSYRWRQVLQQLHIKPVYRRRPTGDAA